MAIARKIGIIVLTILLTYVTFLGLYTALNPKGEGQKNAAEDNAWIETSDSWLDRTSCRWFGVCGGINWTSSTRWWRPVRPQQVSYRLHSHRKDWHDPTIHPSEWTETERAEREIPQFVFDYAPLVHLFSGEEFWPTDIADHLHHTTPKLNYTTIESRSPNLTSLDTLNRWDGGRYVYLTSNDDPDTVPDWLQGRANIPQSTGKKERVKNADVDAESHPAAEGESVEQTAKKEGWYTAGEGSHFGFVKRDADAETTPSPSPTTLSQFDLKAHQSAIQTRDKLQLSKRDTKGGRSKAPAVLIVVDKGNGIIDAFWFYFYSFNQGTKVLNIRFGNHVGDWEHSMVRFQHGVPKAVFLSEHNFGSAFTYDAVEKLGKRPIIYSAVGSHALYATPGTHPYVLPLGLLHDTTDRGPLWDPALNSHSYTYNYTTDTLRSATSTPYAPTQWFFFAGRWGDLAYPLSDHRQYRFAGQCHWVTGPLGPRWKELGRREICAGGGEKGRGKGGEGCVIKPRRGGT